MRHFSLMIFICIICISACKKGVPIIPEKIVEKLNFPPREFTVTVVTRDINTATLEWQTAVDDDGDMVTYSIELNGIIIANQLSNTTYQVKDLKVDLSYKGKVIAKDKSGAERVSEFIIIPYLEQILMSKDRSGGINSYNAEGALSWKVDDSSDNMFSVSNDTVFAAGDNEVYAASLADGKVLWAKQFYPIHNTTIMYYGGKVVFATYNEIFALDAKDGSTLWSVIGKTGRDLVISNGILFSITDDALSAIDLKTGGKKWTKSNLGILNSMPVAKDGVLLYLHHGFLYAVDVQSGAEKWKYAIVGSSLGLNGASSPKIFGQYVYYISSPPSGYSSPTFYLCAINLIQGTLTWSTQLPTYNEVTSLAVDENGIYASSTSNLFKVNRINGDLLWIQSGDFYSGPTIVKDKLYVLVHYQKKMLTTFDSSTGQKIKSLVENQFFLTSPVVIKDKVVYYPSRSGMNNTN